ncbi:MAG TPA: lysophospholipid acyltransferase family protein [Syntrophorhabdaceae bacterium]
MSKRLKRMLMLQVLPPLIYLFLLFLRATSRIGYVYSDSFRAIWEKGENVIVCFWHGRLLMMPFANKRGKGKVLISRHRDGEFIARVMGYFNLGTIRGSYRKGTVSSLREIIHDLRDGFDVAITPDGPKGPRFKVKPGIVELAKLTGKPIVPLTYGASKKKLSIPGTGLLSPAHFQGY